jgi:hypothetical protein
MLQNAQPCRQGASLKVDCSFLNRSDGFTLEAGKKLGRGGHKYETLQHHVDSMQFRQ